jgi:hypothetical protein
MSSPTPRFSEDDRTASARHIATRDVVMVTSPGQETTLGDVASNLASVSGEVGQRVVLLSTAGLASPAETPASPQPATLWWRHWPNPENSSGFATAEAHGDLLAGPVNSRDVEDLLGATGIAGVSRLDLRYFIGHPSQVVTRVPDVLDALRQVVDLVIMEVPSYLSVHHGEALTPYVDAVLVVGERDKTTVDEVRKTSAALRRLGAPVVGITLTISGAEPDDLWGANSEIEPVEEEPGEERHSTAEIPVTRPEPIEANALIDAEFAVEHASPEA